MDTLGIKALDLIAIFDQNQGIYSDAQKRDFEKNMS